jgi:choline dehydrogenase-like flavoprotein
MSNNIDCPYDFIVCGAGCAGTTIATKLSKYYNVLLLEFGKNEQNNVLITDPLASGTLVNGHTNEFFYPGGHESPLPNRLVRNPLITGALLGGGGSVNGMQYVEGTKTFFDTLVTATNDTDYSAENAAKIYEKLEKFNPVGVLPPSRGVSGPIDIRQACNNIPAATAFVNAANAVLGIPIINDYNLLTNEIGGDIYWQLTQQPDKTRESPATAFIYPNTKACNKCKDVLKSKKCKGNLTVVSEVFVTKVIFDDCTKTPKAVGVEVSYHGENCTFKANEIILSAGYQSPLILQRSGVGPCELLSDNCIDKVYVNNNVGQHILNHPIVTVTGTGIIPGIGTDPQGLYDGVVFTGDSTATNPNSRAYEMIGIAGTNTFTIASLLLDAKSEGYTEIISKNPAHMPKLHFGYFTDPRDKVSVVDMVNKQIQILTDPAGLNLTLLTFGGNTNPTFADIEPIYTQAYHWVGGCRIGQNSSYSVVDRKCRVFGVKNLRVVDTSVFPINCLGNAQAPAYYIGALIANKILKKSKRGKNC